MYMHVISVVYNCSEATLQRIGGCFDMHVWLSQLHKLDVPEKA